MDKAPGGSWENEVKRIHKFAMVAVLLAMALPLAAQNGKVYRDGDWWVEEVTGNFTGARSLRVRTDAGSITVQGGAQPGITFTVRKRVRGGSEESARRDLAAFRISNGIRGGMATLEGDAERHNFRNFSVDFTVNTPREMEVVRAQTDGGSVSVRNIAGRVDTESGGGSVALADITGPVTAETGGGSVDVTNGTGELNLRTGGGSIKINSAKGKVMAETGGGSISVGPAQQSMMVQTGGGSISLQACGADVHASTGGGSVEVGDVGGRADIETGGGSIRLSSAKGWVTASTGGGTIQLYKLMNGARAETGAGSITAEFLAVATDSKLETSVGDVIVYLSPTAKVTVNAALDVANGHKIRSDFPELKVTSEGGEWGPKQYRAEGSLNGGGHLLRVRTTTGNIEFRKASK